MPDGANSAGPAKWLASLAANGCGTGHELGVAAAPTAETTDWVRVLKVHSTVSPARMFSTAGENDPSAATCTWWTAAASKAWAVRPAATANVNAGRNLLVMFAPDPMW